MKLNCKQGILWTGASLVTIVLTLGVAALTPRRWSRSIPEPCAVTIYLSGDWLHTNIIVPVKTEQFDWQQILTLTEIGHGGKNSGHNYQYLAFGLGDRDFYLNTPRWADFRLSTLLKSLLISTETVMHIQGLQQIPRDTAGYRYKAIYLDQQSYRELSQFILNSLKSEATGRVEKIRKSHRNFGSFYAANGSYSLLRTCNDWSAQGLQAARINTPLWSGLAPGVIKQATTRCQL
jgi:uncharacterized protein (TIGR02117 family)